MSNKSPIGEPVDEFLERKKPGDIALYVLDKLGQFNNALDKLDEVKVEYALGIVLIEDTPRIQIELKPTGESDV